MNMNMIGFWGLLLNITVLLFCLVIMIYLGYHFMKYQKLSILKKKAKAGMGDMKSEIALQIIKQETERAFNNIRKTLKKEHKKIQKLMEIGELKNNEIYETEVNETIRTENGPKKPKSGERTETPHQEVLKMIKQGKSMSQISNHMRISLEEIDLILEVEKEYLEYSN